MTKEILGSNFEVLWLDFRDVRELGWCSLMRSALTVVLVALIAAGCSRESPEEDVKEENPPVLDVRQDDPEMNEAIAQAQGTLTNFLAALAAPKTNQDYFLIKGRFTAGDRVEHIWVADIEFTNKVFRGVLANEPNRIPGLSFKQAVEVESAQVSDWMYVEDGKLVGGYTSRVVRKRMTPEQRRRQDVNLPYRYE
jgi:uncharacterized protein YegJ (DUF2314 family)